MEPVACPSEAGSKCHLDTINARCFVRGTLVHTEDGFTPIEWIEVGSKVLSRSEVTGEQAYREVVQTFEHENQEVLSIVFSLDDGKFDCVDATAEHLFWVSGVGWVEAGKLEAGQRLEICDPSGQSDEYRPAGDRAATTLTGKRWNATVESVEQREETWTVFSFEVKDFHTYFVGMFGAWVHNSCEFEEVRNCTDSGQKQPDSSKAAL